ncbi:MAG: ATP-binding protein [bacterium]
MFHSFRLKIGLLSVVLSGLMLSGFGLFALSMLNRVGVERVDRELRALADVTIRQSQPPGHWARFDAALSAMYGKDAARQFLVKATIPNGQTLYVSADWPLMLPAAAIPLSLASAPKQVLEIPKVAPLPPPRPLDDKPPRPDDDKPPRLSEDGKPPPPSDEEPSRRTPPRQLPVQGPVCATFENTDVAWRVMTIANEEVTLSIAHNLSGLRAETQRFLHAFLVAVPLGLLLIVAGGWLIGHLALRPVTLIARTAESVTAARLNARIPEGEADDEFQHLISLINGMLERLERSFRQTTRFSADAAHELKTPLAVLQAQIERTLRRSADDSEEQRNYAEQLEELQRLKSILRKLLLLSQADAGQMSLSLERINLADRVRASENDIALLAPGRKTHVQTPAELFIQADDDLLAQILGNLVSNAVKFSDPEGLIDLKLAEQDGQAVLTISNTGMPIPQADHAKVFDRFYRADAARSRDIEGSGLGLSLAREMARAHGGDLTLLRSDSALTTFALRLPL